VRGMCSEAKAEEKTDGDLRREILSASLKHVPRWGWTQESIAAGSKDLGLSLMAHGMFPRGGIELIEHLHDTLHEEWLADLEATNTQGHTTVEKLLFACRTRLLKQSGYMSAWPQALALQAMPLNAPAAIANLARTCDAAWMHAGDQSVDASWYSKRMMLGGVYMAAEVYMLTDYSVDFEDTFSFLDRQLRDVQSTGAQLGLAFQQVEVLMQQALQSMKDSRQK